MHQACPIYGRIIFCITCGILFHLDDAAPTAENKGLSTMLPPAPPQASNLGIVEWKNLQLAPPPPMYRPFAILNEERGEKKSRIQKMREKIGKHIDNIH